MQTDSNTAPSRAGLSHGAAPGDRSAVLNDPATAALERRKKTPPRSFGELAGRIRSRTTDVLAVAVVLIGGVAVGTRVRDLWKQDEADHTAPVQMAQSLTGRPNPVFNTDQPVTLDFGTSPWILQRATFQGTRQEAAEKLRAKCRRLAETIPAPSHPLDAAEKKLLNRLRAAPPVAVTSTGCRVYRVDGPVMMASVTGPLPAPGRGDNRSRNETSQRLLCWGLTFPAGNKHWIAYIFLPTRAAWADSSAAVDLPLPPQARPVLTIRTAGGHLTRTFETGGSVESVWRFYQRWFPEHGWTLLRESPANGTALFVRPAAQGRLQAELQITTGNRGETSGAVFVHQQRAQ